MSFNIEDVLTRVRTTLAGSDGPTGVRQLYMEEIMDWSDNYNENFAENPEDIASINALVSISKLWVAYAHFEANLRQFKKAQQVFDNAIADAIAGKCKVTYLEYAAYCKNRNKLANAHKVYVKGVTAPDMCAQDRDMIWMTFLDVMHETSPDLTIDGLVSEVQKVVSADASMPPLVPPSSEFHEMVKAAANQPAEIEVAESKEVESLVTGADPDTVTKESEVSTDMEVVASEAMVLTPVATTIDMDPEESKYSLGSPLSAWEDTRGWTAEQLFQRHFKKIPTLFVAPGLEPLARGLTVLTPEEIEVLEKYFNADTDTEAEKVVLDATCVDQLKACQQECQNDAEKKKKYKNVLKLELVLDVIEGLWTMQALKERHFDAWCGDIYKLHAKQDEEIRMKFKTNAITKSYADDQAKMTALKHHQNRCLVQRDVITATINKTLFYMVKEHVSILNLLNVPYFDEKIITLLNNAAEDGHAYTDELMKCMGHLKKICCSLLSIKFEMNRRARGVDAVSQLNMSIGNERTHLVLDVHGSPSVSGQNTYGMPSQGAVMESRGNMYANLNSGKKRRRRTDSDTLSLNTSAAISKASNEIDFEALSSTLVPTSTHVTQSIPMGTSDRSLKREREHEPFSAPVNQVSAAPAKSTANLPLLQKLASMLENAKKK